MSASGAGAPAADDADLNSDYRRSVSMADHPRAVGAATDGGTVTSLRQRNRALALTHILKRKTTTRAELAKECGVSAASAANLVTELIADGLVVEDGHLSPRGGRPTAVIKPHATGAYAIGAEVGERGVAVELFDFACNRVDREFRGSSHEETPEAIERDLEEAVAALRERNADAWHRVIGVGLALPGVVEVEADGKQALYARSLGWNTWRVPETFAGGLPVFADNGAKTQTVAEMWFGSAVDVDDAVVALLGRGVGMGIIAHGQIMQGPRSSATEWGHAKVRFDGRVCRCGGTGCVEAYVGSDALVEAWRAAGGKPGGDGWTTIGALFDAAKAGDASAQGVVDDAIEALGAGLGSIVNLTNPSRMIVGGWVGMRLMESHADALLEAVVHNSLERLADGLDLVPASFGGDGVALGAALMPIEALIRGGAARG